MSATADKTKKKTIIPFGNRILVEIQILTTIGGIELPPGSEEGQIRSGYIRAIGCGIDNDLIDSTAVYGKTESPKSRGFKIGDKVYLPRGISVGDKFTEDDGKILLVIPPDYISAIIEEE